MLRITKSNRASQATLRVEGHLDRESLGELRRACEPFLDRPADLAIDLHALRFLDDAAVELVRELRRRGVRIRRCSRFVESLLEGEGS